MKQTALIKRWGTTDRLKLSNDFTRPTLLAWGSIHRWLLLENAMAIGGYWGT
ncbi:hypothetical protein [Levilactobacillus yonginensis]|uniref:hypothetical protein n=1 Tax=Levilactobacillus yonginensis TaxID=1054041 RepID=UPI0013DE4456|nr:hypothetical protein [Levilactobacillus yonginensis]